MNRLVLASAASAALLVSAGAAFAADEEPAICTDRPTKANSTCTVPAGKWQVEADIVNYTNFDVGGVRAETTLFTNPTLKFGIDDRSDLQVTWSPQVRIETHVGGLSDDISGPGDVLVRYKRRLTADDAAWGVSVIPFVKIPTARRGIGNREFEGGVALPIGTSVNGYSVTFGPEVDVLLDADGDGYHAALINLVNVAHPLNDRVTMIGELWMANNFDPAGQVNQASADVAFTYAASRTIQLDIGANFGLNSDTPDYQLYAGVSRRF